MQAKGGRFEPGTVHQQAFVVVRLQAHDVWALGLHGVVAAFAMRKSVGSIPTRSTKFLGSHGPVAQLGARFHGMEKVEGSNPSRSTKMFLCSELGVSV